MTPQIIDIEGVKERYKAWQETELQGEKMRGIKIIGELLYRDFPDLLLALSSARKDLLDEVIGEVEKMDQTECVCAVNSIYSRCDCGDVSSAILSSLRSKRDELT